MRKVGFIIFPGYQPMGFAVTAPFEIANRQAAEPVYDIRMLSKDAGRCETHRCSRPGRNTHGQCARPETG